MNPKRSSSLVRYGSTLVFLGAAFALGACSKPIPPPDPNGADIVEGSVVAAVENTGGIRIYKVIHVDELPPPYGWSYHFIVYDPKAKTYEEARDLRRDGGTKMLIEHAEVQKRLFLTRDHRIIGNESVSDNERSPYLRDIKHSH